MKIKLLSTWLIAMLLGFSGFSQPLLTPVPKQAFQLSKSTPTLTLLAPDMAVINQQDAEREKNGQMYRIGVASFTNITTENAGSWSVKPNGDRVWQLHVNYTGAEALTFLFTTFKIYDASYLDVYNTSGKRVAETLTKADVLEHFQKNVPLCYGDEMTLQLTEPAGSQASELLIDRIIYNYRSTGNPHASKINESESCELNVNCSPVGDAWQDEKRGVARIYVVEGGTAGYCSGSLVNNTALNCKPYFLTAQHCGVDATAADFNQWLFNFSYEAPTCTNPSSSTGLLTAAKRIDGCVLLSNSVGVNGNSITSSDFILVQLGTLANEAATITKLKTAAINAYWNGWDANNTANTGGAGIHHPAGDIKKISTYSGTLVSTNYSSGGSNTHWRVTWTANSNGHGVTEGGSSGSPIFNTNGGNSRIIGTLSGGSSYCSALSSPDLYGKMSYHWTSNGATDNRRLKPFLDPGNTGALVLNGSSDPCSAVVPAAPVAQFVGTPTTVNVGGIVQFTDQSTNTPTSWVWAITPATGWNYSTGSATSQNPAVTFTAQGVYTVSLTATNAVGSDSEVKTNYITVTVANAPCTATSDVCDEFIQNVTLGSINNTSACEQYEAYAATTVLAQNVQYTLTITPQRTGQAVGTSYIDDEMAAWIDYNNDLDFDDAGERIAYVIVAAGYSNVFSFTVPGSAVLGQHKLRVRLSYNGTDGGGAPIVPCGTSTYGEVEDYTVTIIALAGLNEASAFDGVSVFPNPATDKVSVDLSGVTGTVSVELMDLTGKVLAVQTNVAGTLTEFDMTHFAKGMYQVRMNNGSDQMVQKVIKL